MVFQKAMGVLSYLKFRCVAGRTYGFTHCGKEAVVHIADRRDYLFWRKFARGAWERKTLEIMSRYLTPQSVCLDIGAWIGPTVLHEAMLCKHVFALEPDPIAFPKLKATVAKACPHNVTLLNCALTAEDGVVALATKGRFGDTRSSMLQGEGSKEMVEVRGVTIETLAGELALPQIDFLKLDIEGGEFLVLNSMRVLLSRDRPHFHLSLHPCAFGSEGIRERMSEVAELASMWKHCYYARHHEDLRLREFHLSEMMEPKNLVRDYEVFLTNTDARSMGFEVEQKQ